MSGINWSYICKEDPNFPILLKEIEDCPAGLYYKGNFCKEKLDKTLAVVGTRHSSRYSKEVLRLLLPDLILNGFTIVSGFMYGVDFEAHTTCINSNGCTVAVLPYGIDFCPPNGLAALYEEILKNDGLIVSEYPEKYPPNKWTFVARNRIVAGLSRGVLVVEAGVKSGSFITVSVARNYSRFVFSVPGPITSPTSEGTNNLLKASSTDKLTHCVTSSKDILFSFGMESQQIFLGETSKVRNDMGHPNSMLLNLVEKNSGCNFEELLLLIGGEPEELIYSLTTLQISGLIVEEGGRYYVI